MDIKAIDQTLERIGTYVKRTPLEHSRTLGEYFGMKAHKRLSQIQI